jgi:ABC-type transporter Mla subunit MlaD
MTSTALATFDTLESLELDHFNPNLLREFATQRIDAAKLHLQAAQVALQEARRDRDFHIGDEDETPAYRAMQRVETALASAADCLNEVQERADVVSEYVIGVTEIAQALYVQSNELRAEYDDLSQNFHARVEEELLNQIPTTEEMDREQIRSIAHEINDAGGDAELVFGWYREDLERTLRTAEQLAAALRQQQYLQPAADDEDEYDSEDDDAASA